MKTNNMSDHVVPPSLLFHYAFAIPPLKSAPGVDDLLKPLPDAAVLPFPARLDGQASFADVRLSWHASGLWCQFAVSGKQEKLFVNPARPAESDGLHVWIDTRDTQTIHRANRYCHRFCVLPRGLQGGKTTPLCQSLEINRSSSRRSRETPADFVARAESTSTGYRCGVWLPGEMLDGWDPANQPRLGFYCVVMDSELGWQHLSVNSNFPADEDPSLWSTLELEPN